MAGNLTKRKLHFVRNEKRREHWAGEFRFTLLAILIIYGVAIWQIWAWLYQ